MEKHTPETKWRGSSSGPRPAADGRGTSSRSGTTIECKALQKRFRQMCTAVVGGVSDELYAREIIDQETLEITTKQNLTDREKGHKVMQQLMKAVELKPDLFEDVCAILEAEPLEAARELARNLRSEQFILVYNV